MPAFLQFVTHCSEIAQDFVYSCLTKDANDRPSAWQLQRHAFVKVSVRNSASTLNEEVAAARQQAAAYYQQHGALAQSAVAAGLDAQGSGLSNTAGLDEEDSYPTYAQYQPQYQHTSNPMPASAGPLAQYRYSDSAGDEDRYEEEQGYYHSSAPQPSGGLVPFTQPVVQVPSPKPQQVAVGAGPSSSKQAAGPQSPTSNPLESPTSPAPSSGAGSSRALTATNPSTPSKSRLPSLPMFMLGDIFSKGRKGSGPENAQGSSGSKSPVGRAAGWVADQPSPIASPSSGQLKSPQQQQVSRHVPEAEQQSLSQAGADGARVGEVIRGMFKGKAPKQGEALAQQPMTAPTVTHLQQGRSSNASSADSHAEPVRARDQPVPMVVSPTKNVSRSNSIGVSGTTYEAENMNDLLERLAVDRGSRDYRSSAASSMNDRSSAASTDRSSLASGSERSSANRSSRNSKGSKLLESLVRGQG